MRYMIIHRLRSDSGELHRKWLPSAHYDLSAEYLLKQMQNKPADFDFLVVPYILTLCAGLEANLNDWLIVDTFAKHGPEQYIKLAEAYTGVSFAKKIRLVVPVLTDNTFQLREDSPTVKQLDKLIIARNRITHPVVHYVLEKVDEHQEAQSSDKSANHPLRTLTLEDCKMYFEAITQFDTGFFRQYDRGYVEENELIREIHTLGRQVPKQKTNGQDSPVRQQN